MIFETIIIVSLVLVFIILIRRLPNIRKSGIKTYHNIADTTPVRTLKSSLSNKNEKMSSVDKLEQADQMFKNKKYQEAENIYIKLASREPNNPKVYNRLGVLYLEQSNFFDAKEAFRQTLNNDDKKATRWYNYSLACTGLKEYRNAIEALEKAIKLDNKNNKYGEMLKEVKGKLKKV